MALRPLGANFDMSEAVLGAPSRSPSLALVSALRMAQINSRAQATRHGPPRNETCSVRLS